MAVSSLKTITPKDARMSTMGAQLIKLLIQGETVTAAATDVGLTTRQARRIIERPENQACLRAALQSLRIGAIETARARMEQLAPRAVEWLMEVGEGSDPHAKVKAAAQILDRNRGTQRGQVYSVGPAEQIDALSDTELMERAKEAALILQKEGTKTLAAKVEIVEAEVVEESNAGQ